MAKTTFLVPDYDLAATLTSGQAFRWKPVPNDPRAFTGVIAARAISLQQAGSRFEAAAPAHIEDWTFLRNYLQLDVNLDEIIKTFPDDPPMRAAIAACRGLRLLRQDPWETLASFILSSTKQIVQIQQIIESVCRCYGEPITGSDSFTFPSAPTLASLQEKDLRACKMGFRAPYLLQTAKIVARGELNLAALQHHSLDEARAALCLLPGVGEKIANCVLLFAYDFPQAFPIDVWVQKALRQLYFPKRAPKRERLIRFARAHFGPYSGYAQQYLFHYMRVANRVPLK